MSLTAGSRPDGTRPPAAVEEPTAAVAAAVAKDRVPRKAGKAGRIAQAGAVLVAQGGFLAWRMAYVSGEVPQPWRGRGPLWLRPRSGVGQDGSPYWRPRPLVPT